MVEELGIGPVQPLQIVRLDQLLGRYPPLVDTPQQHLGGRLQIDDQIRRRRVDGHTPVHFQIQLILVRIQIDPGE